MCDRLGLPYIQAVNSRFLGERSCIWSSHPPQSPHYLILVLFIVPHLTSWRLQTYQFYWQLFSCCLLLVFSSYDCRCSNSVIFWSRNNRYKSHKSFTKSWVTMTACCVGSLLPPHTSKLKGPGSLKVKTVCMCVSQSSVSHRSSLSVYLLVVSQVSTVYPPILTSVFILVLWDACEMPVIHCCDSGWAMGLSCSGAPAEAQFPFVLWCIDPFRPPPECTPLVLTLFKTSSCHGSSCGAHSHMAA